MGPARVRTSEARRAGVRARVRAAPLIAYFDTSAVVKLLLAEDGSDVADELWGLATVRIASWLVYPEACAALAAAERGNRIDERSRKLAVEDLGEACDAMRLVGVDGDLAREAAALAHRHALRGYDAVHLATALAVDDAALVLVTWDRDLADAALRSGRAVVPAP